MFHGSMLPDVQSIMGDIVKDWDCKNIYVGCSGNFTIEKLLAPMQKFSLHSNDVTLYSYCLGNYLTGNSIDISLSDKGLEKISWAEKYMKNPTDCLATIMLMSGIAYYMDRGENLYYARMYNAYKNQFADLHRQTVEKFANNKVQISNYFNGDALQFVKDAPNDVGFITYPPFSTAGRAYINDFAKLESLFVYDSPEYTIFDEDTLLNYFNLIAEKKYWLFCTNMKLPSPFDENIKAVSKTTNRAVPIYVYSNVGKARYVGPCQETEYLKIPRLMLGEDVGDKMELRILSKSAFQTLRSEYLNINILPGNATMAIGVFVDEKLCGAYAFATPPNHAKWDAYIDTPYIYLLSDFSVEPVDYDRLSKLVLYAALSDESKLLAENITRKRIRSLVTTAYSDNPVSMKYRGLFKILNKKETDPSSPYYVRKYQINYGAIMGEWTLNEGLKIWKKKHSQKTGKKENA